MKTIRLLTIIFLTIFFTACGGGGSGGGSSSNSVTGYVLDGAVEDATVCIDLNSNKKCDSDEPTGTTDNEGKYLLNYASSIDLTKYQIIADISASTAKDNDYISGKPNYDYTMSSYDNSLDEVNITPMTSLMQNLKKYTSYTDSEIKNFISTQIKYTDKYDNIRDDKDITNYLTSNYIKNKQSPIEEEQNLNTRLHQINQLMARNMQKSRENWDTVFTNYNYDLIDNSSLLRENANHNTFNYFEEVVESVQSQEISSFDIDTLETQFSFNNPNPTVLQSIFDYLKYEEQASNDLTGEAVAYDYTNLNTTVITLIQESQVRFFFQDEDGCTTTDVNLGYRIGMSAKDFYDSLIQIAPTLSYISNVRYSQVPNTCSTFSESLKNSKEKLEQLETQEKVTTYTVSDFTFKDSTVKNNLKQFINVGANVSSGAIPQPVTPISSQKLMSGKISTCNVGGAVKYAVNPCK